MTFSVLACGPVTGDLGWTAWLGAMAGDARVAGLSRLLDMTERG